LVAFATSAPVWAHSAAGVGGTRLGANPFDTIKKRKIASGNFPGLYAHHTFLSKIQFRVGGRRALRRTSGCAPAWSSVAPRDQSNRQPKLFLPKILGMTPARGWPSGPLILLKKLLTRKA